jgi:phage repressor protein C with HTH and peptisase S24 domain
VAGIIIGETLIFRYIKIIRVTGNSLLPEYHPNDFVIINTHLFFLRTIRQNDILVFQHPHHGTLIKKVEFITANDKKIFVRGTHPTSIDSNDFGAISKGTVMGKVVWHIKKTL